MERGNDFIVGYLIAAMKRGGYDEEETERMRRILWDCLNEIKPEDAEKIGGSWY